jgi:FkbM family methyltransferase
MNAVTVERSSGSTVAYLKNRTRAVVRRFIPAHRRFIRAGEFFLRGGEREVHELSKLVEPGSVAVDVGAHIGDYTYSLCRQLGPNGRVIAVEPLPDLARVLTRATTKLRLPVTVINCALSSKAGEAQLRMPVDNGLEKKGFATLVPRIEGGKTFRVELRRLDDICQNVEGKISFIKIDVEGHELDVLRGGEETIKRHRPNLLVEIEQRHSPVPISETFQFITSLGYRGEFVEEGGARAPLSSFTVETHQTARLGQRSYISNFIFLPV